VIVDAHMHICTSGKTFETEADFDPFIEEITTEMLASGVRGGILAANTTRHEYLDIITRRYGMYFRGLLNMVPDMDRNLADIEKYGGNKNIIGIKVYPSLFPNSSIIKPLEPVLKRIRDRRWIIQVHSNPVIKEELGLPLHIISLASRVDNPVVMVHCGGHQFQQLFKLRFRLPENLYFDTSAIQNLFCDTPFNPHVRWLFDLLGDRLFWASDYDDFSWGEALDALRMYGFTESELESVCYHNCMKMLRDYTSTDLDDWEQSGAVQS